MGVDRPTLPPRPRAASGPPEPRGRKPAAKKTAATKPAATSSKPATTKTAGRASTKPAGSTRPPRDAAPARRVDVREWLGKVRISGFVVIMLGLVVLGTFVLVPTVGTYMDQRQQIQALENAVALSQSEVADLQSQRERWSDPAYITTQARERLYYTMPGEVVYLVDDDLPASAALQEQADVSGDVSQTRTDWMAQFVRSLTSAGAAQVVVPTIGVPDPTPAPDTSPAP